MYASSTVVGINMIYFLVLFFTFAWTDSVSLNVHSVGGPWAVGIVDAFVKAPITEKYWVEYGTEFGGNNMEWSCRQEIIGITSDCLVVNQQPKETLIRLGKY